MATKKKATVGGAILEGLAGLVGSTLAQLLLDPLQKIYEKSPKKFAVKVKGALLLLNEVAELTKKSNTKIDDSVVNAIIDVIKQSAANNKVKV